MKFRKTTVTVCGERLKGYEVENLSDVFKGLQVVVVKNVKTWSAHEATTGIRLDPMSWAGGYSNKTRQGTMQILSNYLENISDLQWDSIQEKIDYQLSL